MEEKLIDVNNSGSIVYSAEINIRLEKDGKTVKTLKTHNTGTVNLFKFMVESLARNNNINGCPFYLCGYKSNSAIVENRDGTVSGLGNECITTPTSWISATRVYGYIDETNIPYASVEYQFLVPGFDITQDCNVLAIYSTDNISTHSVDVGKKPSMYAKASSYYILKDDVIFNGANVIVTWKLKVKNNTQS